MLKPRKEKQYRSKGGYLLIVRVPLSRFQGRHDEVSVARNIFGYTHRNRFYGRIHTSVSHPMGYRNSNSSG